MKLKLPFILICSLLSFVVFGQSEITTTAPFSAVTISVNGAGNVWSFGEGPMGQGLYNSFNGWTYIKYGSPGGIKKADSDYGEILFTTTGGELKEWNSNNKIVFPYAGITNVKAAVIGNSDHNMKYAIGTVKQADGTSVTGVYKVPNISTKASSWIPVWIGDKASTFIDLAEDNSGNLYLLAANGWIYAIYKNDLRLVPLMTNAQGSEIIMGEDHNLYFKASGAGSVYKYNKSNKTWENKGFNGTSFGVDDKGNLYGIVNGEIHCKKNSGVSVLTVANPNELDGNGNTPLTAVYSNADRGARLNASRQAIKNGSDVNKANTRGDYPIHLAAKESDFDIILLLQDNGADMNVTDKAGHTPLYYAVQLSESIGAGILLRKADGTKEDYAALAAANSIAKDMLKKLHEANVNLSTALPVLAEKNNTEVFRDVIIWGGKLTNNSAFDRAVDNNNIEIAKLCLENGGNADEGLGYALKKSSEDMIMLCLEKGAQPGPAISYMIALGDVTKLDNFMATQNISADQILEAAIPRDLAAAPSINMDIVNLALDKGGKTTPYFESAVKYNNPMLVSSLLSHGGDPNVLLKHAVENQSVSYVNKAMAGGGSANANGNLLQKAVDFNNTEIALILINADAKVTSPGIVKTAVEKGNEKIVVALLEKGAPATGKHLISSAVGQNNVAICRALLENGADPNHAILTAIKKNYDGITAIMLEKGADATKPALIVEAVSNDNAFLTKELLAYGANPDHGMKTAINGGKNTAFSILVAGGADMSKSEYVYLAVKSNRDRMFVTLKDNGAPMNHKTSDGENLMHIAAVNGNYYLCDLLSQAGVDMNAKTNAGDSMLHLAAGSKSEDLCSWLISNGADVNAENNKGKSVLKVANGRKVKKLLKEKGATK
ncbi:MAG: ankyrin repeat protein [Crocinitomix sp.]|jgi:ankyrin repeat protein